mmetsp:Transcript_10864/g.16217  ORF Transcript_10864/g.16217 Transcript_10864/m.16217 type:complete len:107 (+) Transcript_10864:176-496(+)
MASTVKFSSWSLFCKLDSVWLSSALVLSSITKTLGFLNKALAIATLCFWPPLSLLPLSPTSLSSPYLLIMSMAWALVKHSIISSSVASESAKDMLYLMLPLKRMGS